MFYIVLSSHVEFHSSSSIICYFDKFLMPAGQMTIQATNNGKDFGIGTSFAITGILYYFFL